MPRTKSTSTVINEVSKVDTVYPQATYKNADIDSAKGKYWMKIKFEAQGFEFDTTIFFPKDQLKKFLAFGRKIDRAPYDSCRASFLNEKLISLTIKSDTESMTIR